MNKFAQHAENLVNEMKDLAESLKVEIDVTEAYAEENEKLKSWRDELEIELRDSHLTNIHLGLQTALLNYDKLYTDTQGNLRTEVEENFGELIARLMDAVKDELYMEKGRK